jgi:hypothetical protein
MKRKLLFGLAISALCSTVAFSQKSPISLNSQFKVELGLHGVGIAYEFPLAEKVAIDLSTGYGGLNRNGGYILSNDEKVSFFAKSEIKYFRGREARQDKGKSLIHNSGNYLAFQTKFNNNTLRDGKVIMNELHWGRQVDLGTNILFQMHLGLGHYKNLDTSDSGVYPGFGIKFSYVFF